MAFPHDTLQTTRWSRRDRHGHQTRTIRIGSRSCVMGVAPIGSTVHWSASTADDAVAGEIRDGFVISKRPGRARKAAEAACRRLLG